nr:hypothetical protein [Streptomyces sp. CB01580]
MRPESAVAAIAARRHQTEPKLAAVEKDIGQLGRERGRLTVRGGNVQDHEPRPGEVLHIALHALTDGPDPPAVRQPDGDQPYEGARSPTRPVPLARPAPGP